MFRRAVPPRDRPIVAALRPRSACATSHTPASPGLKLLLEADLGTDFACKVARGGARRLPARRAARRRSGRRGHPAFAIRRAGRRTRRTLQRSRPCGDRDFGSRSMREATGLPSNWTNLPFPDLVAIDGGWFRTVARQAATAQLFRAAGARLQIARRRADRGHRQRGRASRRAGFRRRTGCPGPLLAPAALAGAVFPGERRCIESLL